MAESLGQIPFGKYKNTDIEDVPTSYLDWIKGEGWFKDKFPKLCKAINDELLYRERFGGEVRC